MALRLTGNDRSDNAVNEAAMVLLRRALEGTGDELPEALQRVIDNGLVEPEGLLGQLDQSIECGTREVNLLNEGDQLREAETYSVTLMLNTYFTPSETDQLRRVCGLREPVVDSGRDLSLRLHGDDAFQAVKSGDPVLSPRMNDLMRAVRHEQTALIGIQAPADSGKAQPEASDSAPASDSDNKVVPLRARQNESEVDHDR